ncbi:MAG TPA: hypothetical protein VGR37_08680 [Longimicrobiaceae bacterium]|nr:hypothetical protein [Longimicrobiaceae bacterium]
MKPTHRWLSAAACAALVALGSASSAAAQEAPPPQYRNVLSANPLGLLFEYYNAEYERILTPSTTFGLAGSYITLFDEADYFSLDGKYRYYPQAQAFAGFAIGGTLGYAQVSENDVLGNVGSESVSAFSLGVEIDYNWLVGSSRRFYIGTGIGAKRLFGGDVDSDTPVVLPTIRLVNIGFAF